MAFAQPRSPFLNQPKFPTGSSVLNAPRLPNVTLPSLPSNPISTGGTSSAAAPLDGEIDPGTNMHGSVADDLTRPDVCSDTDEAEEKCFKPNDLLNAFEGWNHAYHGFTRSPVIFDPLRDEARKRMYPQLVSKTGLKDIIDVSADDEIVKTNMSIYQPLLKLHKAFAEDEIARDAHLNLFSTIRGVAELTLVYLDKTVAAGLATVEQQANQDAIQHLLKQISWTNSQAVSQQRNQLYVDTDEKIEACMASLMGQGRFTSFTDDSCQICVGDGQGASPPEAGTPQRFRYCVCCAEVSATVNASVEGTAQSGLSGQGDVDRTNKWSLVERVFWGLKVPEDGRAPIAPGDNNNALNNGSPSQTATDRAEFVRKFVDMFRILYGDIYFEIPDEAQPGVNTSAGTTPKFRYHYPPLSVAQFIELIEIGPEEFKLKHDDDGVCDPDEPTSADFEAIYCPITMEKLKYGICPALKYLVDPERWDSAKTLSGYNGPTWNYEVLGAGPDGEYGTFDDPGRGVADNVGVGDAQSEADNLQNKEKLLNLWVEASLGMVLSARDVYNIRKIGDNDPGRQIRWIESFCDASAVGAFRKLHSRMKSIALDHLTLNLKATFQDKEQVRRLMDRVGEYLMLAELDVGGQREPEALLVGISVERDKTDVSNQAMAQASMTASHMTMQKVQDIQFFGLGRAHVLGFLREFRGGRDPYEKPERDGGRGRDPIADVDTEPAEIIEEEG